MACSRSFIEPQYTLYRFSIYSRILLVCPNDNSNKNCCSCVIILLLFNYTIGPSSRVELPPPVGSSPVRGYSLGLLFRMLWFISQHTENHICGHIYGLFEYSSILQIGPFEPVTYFTVIQIP